MDGILLVDKPAGWTSFDVVAKVRGQLRAQARQKLDLGSRNLDSKNSGPPAQVQAQRSKIRVGHTGTLDPLATGLLVLVTGSFCKRASEFSKLDKVYEVTMKLGKTSTTGDDEGEKTEISGVKPSAEAVQAALEGIVGESMQKPPMYSAIKIDGQRAYKLAREGKTVELEARPVTIYSITEVAYQYPDVTFTCKVSSGTYIRSLVEDVGAVLGTGAYMSGLRRTEVGQFSLENAYAVDTPDLLRHIFDPAT